MGTKVSTMWCRSRWYHIMYHARTVDRQYKVWCIMTYKLYCCSLLCRISAFIVSHLFFQSVFFLFKILASLWSVSVVSVVSEWLKYSPNTREYLASDIQKIRGITKICITTALWSRKGCHMGDELIKPLSWYFACCLQ